MQDEDVAEDVEVHQVWDEGGLRPQEHLLLVHSPRLLRHQSKQGLGKVVPDPLVHHKHHNKGDHHGKVVPRLWVQDQGHLDPQVDHDHQAFQEDQDHDHQDHQEDRDHQDLQEDQDRQDLLVCDLLDHQVDPEVQALQADLGHLFPQEDLSRDLLDLDLKVLPQVNNNNLDLLVLYKDSSQDQLLLNRDNLPGKVDHHPNNRVNPGLVHHHNKDSNLGHKVKCLLNKVNNLDLQPQVNNNSPDQEVLLSKVNNHDLELLSKVNSPDQEHPNKVNK